MEIAGIIIGVIAVIALVVFLIKNKRASKYVSLILSIASAIASFAGFGNIVAMIIASVLHALAWFFYNSAETNLTDNDYEEWKQSGCPIDIENGNVKARVYSKGINLFAAGIGFGILEMVIDIIIQVPAVHIIASVVLVILGVMAVNKLSGGKKRINNSAQKSSSSSQRRNIVQNSGHNVNNAGKQLPQLGDDNIINLISEKGETIPFEAIAAIYIGPKLYMILQPCELLEGMSDDEALVFEKSVNSDGSDRYEIVLDDNIVNAVFREYDKLYDNAR